ncbi:hypothetical protein CCO03_07860 [Comamonas serinivorans]|uniref:Uncharacterized protein n=1 Tax=Comamonas serinivorans TaxID=1082851 RepID=A0A1Y0EMP8_9BURK|nr:hypothetical protein CCO03_07860 [Comamonas serinivorans]
MAACAPGARPCRNAWPQGRELAPGTALDGISADVATLALAGDIDALVKHGQGLPADWQKRLPHVPETVPQRFRNGPAAAA